MLLCVDVARVAKLKKDTEEEAGKEQTSDRGHVESTQRRKTDASCHWLGGESAQTTTAVLQSTTQTTSRTPIPGTVGHRRMSDHRQKIFVAIKTKNVRKPPTPING
jgi:hypothetical protein